MIDQAAPRFEGKTARRGILRMAGVGLWLVLYGIQCTVPLVGPRPPFPGDTGNTLQLEASAGPRRWDAMRYMEAPYGCAGDSVVVHDIRRTYAPRTLSFGVQVHPQGTDMEPARQSMFGQFRLQAVDFFGEVAEGRSPRPVMEPIPVMGGTFGYQVQTEGSWRGEDPHTSSPLWLNMGVQVLLILYRQPGVLWNLWMIPTFRLSPSLVMEGTLAPASVWLRYRHSSRRFHLYIGVESLGELFNANGTTLDPGRLIRAYWANFWGPDHELSPNPPVPGLPYRVVVGLETHP